MKTCVTVVSKIFLCIILLGSAGNCYGSEHTQPFFADWISKGALKLKQDSSALDFQNAYWLAALSQYSYWDFNLIKPFYLSRPEQFVTLQFRNKKDTTDIPIKIRGLGFTRAHFFTSRLSLTPASPPPDPESYIQKWPSPLPLEACLRPNKLHCLARYSMADSSYGKMSQQEFESCGNNFEKAILDTDDLIALTTSQKQNIQNIVSKFESLHHTDLGLDFKSPNFNLRCEAFKQRPGTNPDTQLLWLENDDVAIVVFRGTEFDLPEDRHTDLDTKKFKLTSAYLTDLFKTQKKDLIHDQVDNGALRSLEIASSMLFKEILHLRSSSEKSGHPPKPLFIAGHSMGGALAQILGFYIMEYNQTLRSQIGPQAAINLKAIYSYGAPRIGNESWARHMDYLSKISGVGNYRFIYDKDPVPLVPCDDFKHAGTPVYLDPHKEKSELALNFFSFGQVIIDPPSGIFNSDSCAYINDLMNNITHIQGVLKDHGLNSYYEALKTLF